MRLGIAAIYQELDLVPDLTVAENVFLGHEPARFGLTRRHEANTRARELLQGPRPRRDPAGRDGRLCSPPPASRWSAWRERCPVRLS